MQLTTWGWGAGVFAGALTLAGCGGESPRTGPTATPQPAALVAHLDTMPQGIARLQVDARTKRVTVHLDVAGVAPGSVHAVALHRGTCLQRGALAIAFDDATAGTQGAISADLRATSGTATAIPPGVHLELHAGSAAQTTAQSIPIACADVPDASPTTPVRIFATPGYKPFGTAQLAYDRQERSARLRLDLQTLPADSQHAVQIMSGTCTEPGTVLHSLGDVVADRNGTARATQVFGADSAPPASGWIVMIRTGAARAQTGSAPPVQPLLCGAISKPA